jgi:uncharacterized caspase-like protein
MPSRRLPAFFLWLLTSLALTALPAAAATDKRVALVIGNSAYQNAVQLPNPEGDAKAIAVKLRKLGFVVVEGYNLNHDAFEDTIKDFSKAVRGADIGMFFYAGHGMQVNGKNYLIPVDAAFQDASALDFEAVPIDLVTRQMQQDVGVRLVVLDACRDNPLSKTLSRSMAGTTRSTAIAEGLAEVKLGDAGEGTAIIFATSPDEVALDGDSQHSPFTQALLDNIDAPDTDLQVVMSRVTGEVYQSTRQQQRPWINASLTGEVILNPQKKPAGAASDAAAQKPAAGADDDTLARETALYNVARESGAKEDYEAYLEVFPDGLYAVNARKQLERLDREAEKGEEVASAGPADTTGQPVARTVDAPEVVQLPVTDVVKAMPATSETEDALDFDRTKRREIQTRLELAGFDVGSPDGSFGRKTRSALQAWQTSRGLSPSGYLNQPQYEILMQQTQTQYAALVPDKPAVADDGSTSDNGPRKKTVVRRTGNKRHSGGGNADQVGRFIGGVVRGALRF